MFLRAVKSHGFGMSKTGTNIRWETLCQDPVVSHSPDCKETKAFLYPSAPASQGRDSPKCERKTLACQSSTHLLWYSAKVPWNVLTKLSVYQSRSHPSKHLKDLLV